MAGTVNKAIVVGRLGRDPEVKFVGDGTAVCNFSLATNEREKDKQSGEWVERPEWHNVVAWGKLAEQCGQSLAKGKMAYVEGSLRTRKWTDKDGHERYSTEIVARDVVFLSPKDGGGGSPF